jgi:hypothetical protein
MSADRKPEPESESRGFLTATGPATPASAGLGTGARLGPYEIVSLLGAGGMGEV